MIFIWFIILLLVLYLIETIETYKNFETSPNISPDNCYYLFKDEKLSERRKQVLYDLDAVRSEQFMLTNRDMQFTGGCAINPQRDLNYLKPDINCVIIGDTLSDNIDEMGLRKTKPIKIKLKTQLDYSFPNITPKYGCYIDSTNKEEFFKTIDKLADIKFYNTDKEKNIRTVELENANNMLKDISKTSELYGIDFTKNVYIS